MFDPPGEERAEGLRIHHLRERGDDAGADQDRQGHHLRHGSRPSQGHTQTGMLLSSVMKLMSNKQFSSYDFWLQVNGHFEGEDANIANQMTNSIPVRHSSLVPPPWAKTIGQ